MRHLIEKGVVDEDYEMLNLTKKAIEKIVDIIGKALVLMIVILWMAFDNVLNILWKAIVIVFDLLGNAIGKEFNILGKLKEKVEETAAEEIAERSMNTGTCFCNLGSDIKLLERRLKELRSRAADIKEEVETAEISGRRRRKTEVQNWLQDVGDLVDEFNDLEKRLKKKRFWKHLFSWAVVRRISDRVTELTDQSRNFGGLLLDSRGK